MHRLEVEICMGSLQALDIRKQKFFVMATVTGQFAKICQWTLNSFLPEEKEPEAGLFNLNVGPIVVISPYFIGDTLLAGVFLENLEYVSKQEIHVIAPAHQLNMLETVPYIKHCHLMPPTLLQKEALLRKINCGSFFLLRYSLPWALAAMNAGVLQRVGFDLERFGIKKLSKWAGLLTHTTQSGEFDSDRHQIDFYRGMASELGLSWDAQVRPAIYLSKEDYYKADSLIGYPESPRIMIHVTAGSPGKRWPLPYWADLLKILDSRYKASFIAVGTSSDASVYKQLESLARVKIHNFCGETTLRESAALCQLSDLVITLDTAIAHIAAAVESPRLIVIYGPTNYNQWRPLVSEKTHLQQVFLKVKCRPCITRSCYHRSCLGFLSAERLAFHVDLAFNSPPH